MNLVKLTDLDDYLMPAQDCVVISTNNKKTQEKGKLILENEYEPKPVLSAVKKPNLIKKDAESDKAVVNLYDCLACSGCVTSSEVVLMEVLLAEQQHGVKNMLALLEKAAVGVVVLSPQSRAALCKELGLTPRDLMFKLEVFLKKFNSSLLLDLQFFIDLHQNLHYIEIQQSKSKPVITSECPGWICYVEKIVKEPLIKLCSRIKSPMMLAGDIVRKLFSLAGLVGPAHQSQESIALVGVAPCHDKKLETFRPETATGSTA